MPPGLSILHSGDTVAVHGRIAPVSAVTAVLTLTARHALIVRHGVNLVGTNVIVNLYSVSSPAKVTRVGAVTALPRVSYAVRKVTRVRLTVTLFAECGRASRSVTVVLAPPVHRTVHAHVVRTARVRRR